MILYCKYAHFYPIVTKKILKGTACGMKQIKTHYDCSLELAMELVGGKWKLVLLWQLLGGAKRFSELKRKLGDITQKMLTLQLRELGAAHPDGLSGHPAPCGIFVDGKGDGARPGAAGLVRMVGKIRRGERHYACPAAALRGRKGFARHGGIFPGSLTFGINMGNALGLTNCEVPASRRSSCSKVYLTGCPARSAP